MCVFMMHGATNKTAYLFSVISFYPPFLCLFPPALSSSNFPSIIPKIISEVCVLATGYYSPKSKSVAC